MGVKAKKDWQPLDLSTLPDCSFIACDPSLTALGIVLFDITDGTVVIRGAEKLSTVPTDRKGWEDTFYRAELMEALLAALFDSWGMEDEAYAQAVHEAPPTGGGAFVRTEATILTGFAFRCVANECNLKIDRTVTPQSMKKLITGNHLASKAQVAKEIKALLPKIEGRELITNEATRDALGVGLYAAWRSSDKS